MRTRIANLAFAVGLVFAPFVSGGQAAAQTSQVVISNLDRPTGLDFDADGHLYVASSTETGSIIEFDAQLNRSTFAGNIQFPASIYVKAKNIIYAISKNEDDEGFLYRADRTGTGASELFGIPATAVHASASGRVLIAQNNIFNTIYAFNDVAKNLDYDYGNAGFVAESIDIASNGAIYAGGSSAIQKFSAVYSHDRHANISGGSIKSIAIDSSGVIFATLHNQNKIIKVAIDGQVSDYLITSGRPSYLAFDNNGVLYYTDTNAGTVNKVDPTSPSPVPTMTEWAMILMGLALAGGAVVTVQRRRMVA